MFYSSDDIFIHPHDNPKHLRMVLSQSNIILTERKYLLNCLRNLSTVARYKPVIMLIIRFSKILCKEVFFLNVIITLERKVKLLARRIIVTDYTQPTGILICPPLRIPPGIHNYHGSFATSQTESVDSALLAHVITQHAVSSEHSHQ